ncbi:MAG: transporter [Clostridia bacterium]|jgi:iron complex transport system permease protein|nr:transporter [Clostridia bacterium]
MTLKNQHSIPFIFKFIAALIIFIGMFVVSMAFGAADITIGDVWLALTSDASGKNISIIQEFRLPRELAAIFVGAALGVSGAIMQGMTRNPLADPGLLGLTSGSNAALAVTLAFMPSINYFGIMIACFIGAAAGAALVFGIGSLKRGGFSPFRIILAGAAISAFLTALAEGIGIYFKLSKDISMWTAGGIIGTSWRQLEVIVPFILVGIAVSLILARQLTILSLSDEVAVGLGQKTTHIKALLFVVIILLAGASVALVGNMAFIGLIVPHVVRTMTGTDYRFIIPMSAICGGTFMLFADTIARTLNAPYETPLVAIIAMVGLPFFLLIVLKGGKNLL